MPDGSRGVVRSRLRSLAILFFSATYLAFQLTMIVLAHSRDDKRFGFWMFAESSNFHARLYRELAQGERIIVPGGVWVANADGHEPVVYEWSRLVREFSLGNLERWVHAPTGLAVTLAYFHHALDFVVDRIPADLQTVQLHMEISYSRAGGPVEQVLLSSKRREIRASR